MMLSTPRDPHRQLQRHQRPGAATPEGEDEFQFHSGYQYRPVVRQGCPGWSIVGEMTRRARRALRKGVCC